MKLWAKLSSYLHRQYFFYSATQLKDRILELDGRAVVAGKNKNALLDLVADCERKRRRQNTMLDNDEDPFNNDEDEVDPVLMNIFQASFMKPLGEEAKKYCREGHLLERPFLKQFHQHCLDETINTCGYNSIAIHETPVGKLGIILCRCV